MGESARDDCLMVPPLAHIPLVGTKLFLDVGYGNMQGHVGSMDKWVVVVGDDAVSKKQMDVCRALKPPLHGAVECHLDTNADASVCTKTRFLPAFCNVQTDECVYGLRTEMRDIEALLTTPTLPQTTAPTPPQGTPRK